MLLSGGVLVIDRICKVLEELRGQLLGRTLDQTTSQLGKFTTYIRCCIVAQQRPFGVGLKLHNRATFGKSCGAAIAFACQ